MKTASTRTQASMFEPLRRHIARRIEISGEEFTRCSSFFVPRTLRKRQFLVQEGEPGRYIAYVSHGCLRTYALDPRGEEHVVEFAVDDWWASDLRSYLTGEPATYNIDAVEESHLLLLDRESRERLLAAVPKMERFFRLLQEANYVATHRRISESLSKTAEERYLNFLKTYPLFVRRLPQKYIASYLGITPQSLSRIRKELVTRQ
jgi:CRP-like cAMP-binding protein